MGFFKKLFCGPDIEKEIRGILREVKEKLYPVQVVKYNEGDIIVFTIPKVLSENACRRLKDDISSTFKTKEGNVVILEEGMKLSSVVTRNVDGAFDKVKV